MPNAASAPPGTYLGSCGGCALADGGAALACTHCDAADGRQLESTLRDPAGCREPHGTIANDDGRLKCERA